MKAADFRFISFAITADCFLRCTTPEKIYEESSSLQNEFTGNSLNQRSSPATVDVPWWGLRWNDWFWRMGRGFVLSWENGTISACPLPSIL